MTDNIREVWDNGTKIAEYEYNTNGTKKRLKNGSLYTEYAYDADQNLTGLKTLLGAETIVDNRYTYDGNGDRLEKYQKHGTTRYGYDSMRRLAKVEYPNATEELFYDKAGNRTRRLYNGAEELYQYDKRNRLTAHTKGGVTSQYEYDNAGNLLKDDNVRYEYDAFNRNTKVETFNGNIQINHYDAEGLRHEMEENTVMQACPGDLYPLSSAVMKLWQRRVRRIGSAIFVPVCYWHPTRKAQGRTIIMHLMR